MTTDTWTDGSDNWNTPADWSTGSVPGSSSAVVISEGDPQVTASIGTIASLTDSANLTFIDAGASSVTGAVTNSGTITLDENHDDGGSSLSIGGALTNDGYIQIGPSDNSLTANSTIDAASVTNFINTGLGTIDIYGSSTAEATLDVSSVAGLGATGTLYGSVNLSGDSLLEFKSGQITTIATNSELSLSGADAFVADAGKLASNSALTGLATNNGGLYLYNGAKVTTGALSNTGTIRLDQNHANGGSSLTTGALSNDGYIQIGPGDNSLTAKSTIDASSVTNYIGTTLGTIAITGSSTVKATLDDAAAAGLGAANTLIGSVNLSGDALLEFASGQITTIDSSSELSLSGPDAFVAAAGALTSNSALAGLATIEGGLYLYDDATVTTTGALTNSGTIGLDQNHDNGGSSLTVGGVLTNTGYIQIGPGDDSNTAASTISASSIKNFIGSTYGTIDVYGNDSSDIPQPIPATLEISGAAGFGKARTLEGIVNVAYDGLIVFAKGKITTIAANSKLSLTDPDAVVADKSNTSSNSALTGLKTIDGGLYLYNGSTVTTTGALTNSGTIRLDANNANGGSSLTVGGGLTNDGTIQIGPSGDSPSLSAASTISASSIKNLIGSTYGAIDVYGNNSSDLPQPIPAALHISGSAGFGVAGTLEGSVNVAYDGQIVFGKGKITTIAANSELSLTDPDAVVADASNTSSNSALTGLNTIDGSLYLYNGAKVTTTGALDNSGMIRLDQYQLNGGSSLTIGGELTNTDTGYIEIGPGDLMLSSSDSVHAASVNNSGTIDLYGGAQYLVDASLTAPGAFINNGTVNFSYDTDTIAGAVSGTGNFGLSFGSTLTFSAGVSSGEDVTFGDDGGAADLLNLKLAQSFDATIEDFYTVGDAVDLTNFVFDPVRWLTDWTG
jgi:hypothetical protein